MASDGSRQAATGGCLCGAVRFALRFPSKWVAHCHCSLCRRAHGAAFVTWLAVPDAAFALLSGAAEDDDALAWHASSAAAERGFCRRCGSPLLFRSRRWPGETHIAVAAIEGGPDRAPQIHVFWDAHVPWTDADPALPKRTEAEILARLRREA